MNHKKQPVGIPKDSTIPRSALRAILAADIVGYSRLMEADEAGTIARSKLLLADLIKPEINAQNGRIVKLTGDGILIEFSSVISAVMCAVEIQRQTARREAQSPLERQIVYRVGINLGDVFYEDGDVFGDGVNIAARLEAMADPGGICISGTVFDHLKSNVPVEYESLGEMTVKNIQQPVRVYRVLLYRQQARTGSTRSRALLVGGLGAFALIDGGAGWWGWNARQDWPATVALPEIRMRLYSGV